jgi:hypothetical protein
MRFSILKGTEKEAWEFSQWCENGVAEHLENRLKLRAEIIQSITAVSS